MKIKAQDVQFLVKLEKEFNLLSRNSITKADLWKLQDTLLEGMIERVNSQTVLVGNSEKLYEALPHLFEKKK